MSLYTTLFEPFPDDVKVTKRMGSKGEITFVEWYHYIARAWKQYPEGFTKEISKLASAGEHLLCVVRITDVESGIFMESSGSAPVDKSSDNFGGAAAEAEHQATKRAFAHFGMGLEMYMDKQDKEQADPERTSMTKAQIARMKQLAPLAPEELKDWLQAEREAVAEAADKKFRCDMTIEQLEKKLASADVEVPDPT
jgi:hypothetical protein